MVLISRIKISAIRKQWNSGSAFLKWTVWMVVRTILWRIATSRLIKSTTQVQMVLHQTVRGALNSWMQQHLRTTLLSLFFHLQEAIVIISSEETLFRTAISVSLLSVFRMYLHILCLIMTMRLADFHYPMEIPFSILGEEELPTLRQA